MGKESGSEKAGGCVRSEDDDGIIKLMYTLQGLSFLCCHRENQEVSYDAVNSEECLKMERNLLKGVHDTTKTSYCYLLQLWIY